MRDQVTTILSTVDDPSAADQLLPLVYEELKRLARGQMMPEAPGQTIQPTALVHEAYVRLVDGANLRWESRGHFFAAAARSMRQILIDRARSRKAQKRGGGRQRQPFDDALFANEPTPERVLALEEALGRLEQQDARKGKIVMIRLLHRAEYRGHRQGARNLSRDRKARVAVFASLAAQRDEPGRLNTTSNTRV